MGANEDAAVAEAANAAQLEEGDLSDALGLSADVKGDVGEGEGDDDMASSDDRESSVTSEVSGGGEGGSGGEETASSERSTSPDTSR